MSFANWLNYLCGAEKSSIMSGRVRKVHYKFSDGKEMVEEYSLDTGTIQRRAWRKCKQLMGEPKWEIEVGDDPRQIMSIGTNNANGNDQPQEEGFLVRESNTEPILSKRVTKKNIEWRIRNLPYPISVYDVKADPEKHAIVVRTTNKKYYKVIPVPDLDRCNLLPEQNNISITHQYNTLIITYQKPKKLIELDVQVLLMLKDVETETDVDDMLKGLLLK